MCCVLAFGSRILLCNDEQQNVLVNWMKINEHAYTINSQTCTSLWHKRVGHFNLRSTAKMKKNELEENMPEYHYNAQVPESCQ